MSVEDGVTVAGRVGLEMSVNYGCIKCKRIVNGSPFTYDGSNCEECGGLMINMEIGRTNLPEQKKFHLEFDEPPALVFVQHKVGNRAQVYQDGKQLNGVRTITIRASIDGVTTHEVEFVTGETKPWNVDDYSNCLCSVHSWCLLRYRTYHR